MTATIPQTLKSRVFDEIVSSNFKSLRLVLRYSPIPRADYETTHKALMDGYVEKYIRKNGIME